MTMLMSLTCDLSPLRGLTNQTFGISVGIVRGQITFELYGDDFATKKQVCKHLVCIISLWAIGIVLLTQRAAHCACCSFWTTDSHSYARARAVEPAQFTPSCVLCIEVMVMIARSIVGAALVATRVSPTEIDMDDVGCLPQAPYTFLIHLGTRQ